MKQLQYILMTGLALALFTTSAIKAQSISGRVTSLEQHNPWTAEELIEPAVLAEQVSHPDAQTPLVLNIGAVEDIKGAKHIGAVSDAANMEKLKQLTRHLPKNQPIVVYCGCCPFTKCPNAAPAFTELKKDGFAHVKVLNLPVNLRTNWIAKGYPLNSGK